MNKSQAKSEDEFMGVLSPQANDVITKKIDAVADKKVEENLYYWKGEPRITDRISELDKRKPVIVELFCGLGGTTTGFEMAGFQTALGMDIHAPSIQTYKSSHETSIAILGDIRKVKPGTLGKLLKGVNVDVLMAGVPCQGFSLCNRKRSIDDERNYLFLYFVEAIKELKPTYVILENVSGMKSLNGGSFVNDIKAAIEECGYPVEHKFMNAADFGVPQTRTRLIFLGARSGFPIIWPPKSHGPGRRRFVTVGDAISDLPPLEISESKEFYLTEPQNNYQSLMRWGSTVPKNHRAPNHPPATVEKIENTIPGEPMYKRFKQRIRLDHKKLSPTQVAGGIRPQFQFGHYDQPRGLSVRERCRIQSIPDRIHVSGGIVQGRVQTGNAVPPLLAKAIAEGILIGLNVLKLHKGMLGWYKNNARKFPWREGGVTPFEILLAEVLLRKTKAENVVQVYEKLVKDYKEPIDLMNAKKDKIEHLLRPLGLSNVRAEALINLGRELVIRHLGRVPKNYDQLVEIPHIGRYIANATLCFGLSQRRPIVDTNVMRVYSRLFNLEKSTEIHKDDRVWQYAEAILPDKEYKTYNYALLDFASSICLPRNPLCKTCFVSDFCLHVKKSIISSGSSFN